MHPDLNTLLEEREIYLALCRYARACDERNWDDLATVFTADMTGDYGPNFQLKSRAELVAMCRAMLDGCGPTQHLLGNLLVERNGEELTSRCYVRAAHRGAGERAAQTLMVWAEYQDRWQHGSKGLRIIHRRMKVDFMQGEMAVLQPGKG